jgi:hypothetical protein
MTNLLAEEVFKNYNLTTFNTGHSKQCSVFTEFSTAYYLVI